MHAARRPAQFDALESRRLLSFGAVGSTIVYEEGREVLVNNDTGARYVLPKVRADGALDLTGSGQADEILVERVDGLDTSITHDPAVFYRVEHETNRPDLSDEPGLAVLAGFYPMAVERLPEILEDRREALTIQESYLALLEAVENPTADQTESLNELRNLVEELRVGVISAESDIEEYASGGFVRVRVPGVYDMYFTQEQDIAQVRVTAGDGDDRVTVATGVQAKVWVDGGTGRDTVTTGSKRAMVYGGSGNDRLVSRSRVGATLQGGKGADRYYNRFGEATITARDDGDAVMAAGSAVRVATSGTFGLDARTGRAYFLVAGGQVDLLA